MGFSKIWRGVRMRDTEAGADPDAAPRALTLPASWDDRAAAALAALAPGAGKASLPRAAESWIRPLAASARLEGDAALADRLHALLLQRKAAPTAPLWGGSEAGTPPGFVLNLPAFWDEAAGFDVESFIEAVRAAATALRLSEPTAGRVAIGFTDLDGLLAMIGLDYESPEARDLAAALAAILRGTVDVVLAGEQPDLLSRLPSWPEPPALRRLPAVAAAAARARREALRGSASLPSTAISYPGPADALLGAETGGIAPAFAAVDSEGRLTRAAQARLAALGISPEVALGRLLAGEPLLVARPAYRRTRRCTMRWRPFCTPCRRARRSARCRRSRRSGAHCRPGAAATRSVPRSEATGSMCGRKNMRTARSASCTSRCQGKER